tara:strand:- start:215 stop:964 length:750 start_codon:yes stop_codon:yes gene_type:complete
MDKLEESSKELNNEGFMNFVFKFDENQKAMIFNIVQYTILAIIPMIIVLKTIKNYVPDVDEEKESLMVLAEVIIQLLVMFLSIYLIHRIIIYIPTYSGFNYSEFSVTNIILSVLIVVLSINSKLGDKVQLLAERVQDLWEGNTSAKPTNKKSGNVVVKQPLSQQYMSNNPNLMMPESMQGQMTNNKSMTNEYSLPQGGQQSPDFNKMYAGPNTPLVGASTPGNMPEQMMNMDQGPAAANDFGNPFGSMF